MGVLHFKAARHFSFATLLVTGLFCAVQSSAQSVAPAAAPPCHNVLTPGVIDGEQSIAPGEIPAPLLEAAPPSGGEGELRYQWMVYKKIGKMPAQWYPILSANSAAYQPGPVFQTTKFSRVVSREGCTTYLESNTITITVTDLNN